MGDQERVTLSDVRTTIVVLIGLLLVATVVLAFQGVNLAKQADRMVALTARAQSIADVEGSMAAEVSMLDLHGSSKMSPGSVLDSIRAARIPELDPLLTDSRYGALVRQVVDAHTLLCRDLALQDVTRRRIWGMEPALDLRIENRIESQGNLLKKALKDLRLESRRELFETVEADRNVLLVCLSSLVTGVVCLAAGAFYLYLMPGGRRPSVSAWAVMRSVDGANKGASADGALSETLVLSPTPKEQALIKYAVDLVCLVDSGQVIVEVSPSIEKILGYTVAEFAGRRLSDFVFGSNELGGLEASLSLSKSRDHLEFEQQFMHKDGRIVDLLWTAHWSTHERAFLCIGHDISERKQQELQVKRMADKLHRLVEHLPVGLCLVDQAMLIVDMNSTLCKMIGRPLAQTVQQPLVEIFPELNSPEHDVSFLLRQEMLETTCATEDGKKLPVEVHAGELDEEASRYCAIAVVDCTQRYELERVKREFLAVVSHELKTPLTSIDATMQLLHAGTYGPLPDPALERILLVSRETKRLSRLVNDLLTVEKMKAGKFELYQLDTPVDELVSESIDALSSYANRLKVRILAPASGLYAYVDGARIIQVLINLLSNALKFSTGGSLVTVSISENNDEIAIAVADSGRGIPPEAMARIFDMYEQVHKSDTAVGDGTGLGLSISKAIVEQHGGRLWAESAPGEGSTFYFTVPTVAPSTPAETDLGGT